MWTSPLRRSMGEASTSDDSTIRFNEVTPPAGPSAALHACLHIDKPLNCDCRAGSLRSCSLPWLGLEQS